MTEHNHHRGTQRKPYKTFKVHHGCRPPEYYRETYPDQPHLHSEPDEKGGYDHVRLSNTYPPPADKPWRYIRGTKKGFGGIGELSGKQVSAITEWESSKGHRGMAKQVRGAKKYVRSRIRFHENTAVRTMIREAAVAE